MPLKQSSNLQRCQKHTLEKQQQLQQMVRKAGCPNIKELSHIHIYHPEKSTQNR